MSETRIERLADICEIVVGRTPSRNDPNFWGQGHPWLSIADMNQGLLITKTKEEITDLGAAKGKLIPAGTVLLSFKLSIGKVSISGIPLYTNEAIAALVIKNPKKIDPRYLMWTLKSMDLATGSNRAAMGATLNKAKLQEIRIPIPPMDEQIRRVQIEDIQYAISQKRERQQELFEELSVSHYERYFGQRDNFDWVKLGDITSKIGSGATPKGGSQAYKSEGIALIRSMNVHDRRFVYEGLAFIDDDQAAALSNVEVQENDILLNITGASVARVCRVPADVLPARVNQHVAIIRLKPGTIEPELLERYLTLPSVKKKLLKIATSGGATREAITKTEILNILSPVENNG